MNKNIENREIYYGIKRISDFFISLCGIIILSLFLVIIAIIIKIDDPKGAIFYSQIRVGKNLKKFKMYKFRSMYSDADDRLAELLELNEVEGPMFKMKNDPRITPIGRFIRKTSVDELPQLFNVLMGQMSLVGPRPPLEREVREYTNYDKQRLLVKPGCTGLWQVGSRNSIGFHEMVELDLEYIKKSGLIFDLGILFKTIKVMVIPNDAY